MKALAASAAQTWFCAFGLALSSVSAAERPEAEGVVSQNQSRSITIGLLLPKDEAQAGSLQEGVVLAAADANRDPGLSVTAVIRGAFGQWGADGVEAARMVTDDQALGLIAPPGGAGSHLALQVAGRTATPVISLCPDSSVTKTGVPWMVRITPSTVDEARTLWTARGLASQLASCWAVVVPPGRVGREIAHDMATAAEEAGLTSPTVIEAGDSSGNVDSLCRSAATAGKDSVLIWLDPVPAGHLVRALRDSGFRGPLAGSSRLNCAEFLEAAGAGAETFRVAGPALTSPDRARYELFTAAFQAKFGREPDATAAMSYDAAQLLISVIKRAGERPPHEVFPLLGEFPGVTGILRFDSDGNRKMALQVLEVQSGRFTASQPAEGPGFVPKEQQDDRHGLKSSRNDEK